MARFEKSRPKSAKPHAAVAPARRRGSTAPSIEDTMFFPRLRRHAKWMFVLLALVFGLGFVLFGVGAGGIGIGDIFRGSGGTSAQSVSDARERDGGPAEGRRRRGVTSRPRSRRRVRPQRRSSPSTPPSSWTPRTPNALRELAGLHLTRATERQQDAQLVQIRAAFIAPAQGFPSLIAPAGQSVVSDPITNAVQRGGEPARQRRAPGRAEGGDRSPSTPTSGSSPLQPQDPNVQLELAQAAQQVGDATTAIAAYERFLKLAPDDPSASVVRQQLKQLRGTAAAASG